MTLPQMEAPEQNFDLLDKMISIDNEFEPDPVVLLNLAHAFYEKNSLKKSHIQFSSRTDWPSFKKYLEWFKNNNYLLYDKTDAEYKPTESGWTLFRLVSQFYGHIGFKKKKIYCINLEKNRAVF
jgi:predicted transcriptional regulator